MATWLTVRALPLVLAAGGSLSSCAGAAEPAGKPRLVLTEWSPALARAPLAGDMLRHRKDGSVLIWIPGGEFTMGASGRKDDERPAHRTRVLGFWLGRFEVTNAQFRVFWKQRFRPDPYPAFGALGVDALPVSGVTWEEAVEYCRWAGLRLPTEAEWEFAAKGGRDQEFGTATGRVSHDLANYWGTGGADRWLEEPAPVGSFPPNAFGIYDLSGNVWEWTSSLYRAYPYSATDGREDPLPKELRVLRGGSWQYNAQMLRSADRYPFRMHLRLDYAGIRVAKSHGSAR